MALPRTTTYWRPESSLTRESFNDIVNRRKTNVPAVLMRSQSMSRLAMLATQTMSCEPRTRPLFETTAYDDSGILPTRLTLDRFPVDGTDQDVRRSVQFDSQDGDGFGSIRLGTPTTEQRKTRRPHFLANPTLDGGALQRSSSMPIVRPTPAARFGFMPPGAGRIFRTGSKGSSARSQVSKDIEDELPNGLLAKVETLFDKMDENHDDLVDRAEARHHFKRFPEVSAKAMFSEVDEDHNNFITRQEFLDFWRQVKKSGYSDEDLHLELDELLKGNVWVDYADSRDVGGG